MDKIASGIVDKLNIIGFFNVILSGGVLLYGISPVLNQYVPGMFYLKFGLDQDLEKALVICLVCYILGSALQSLQELLFNGLKKHISRKCLAVADPDDQSARGEILANQYKRKELIRLAAKLFADKGLGEFDPEDKEMSGYFIDYCEYSNSIKGCGGKAGRLNESASFFEQLAVAFFTLVVVGILILIFAHTNEWAYCIGYLVMGGVFTGRAYQCRLKWAKTVLSTYEVLHDQGASANAAE